MPNALSVSGPPEAPEQTQGAQPADTQQQPQQAAPQPTHGQVVAALRHMNAISAELRGLLKDPNLGKTDVKSALIDSATKLVSSRIIAPGEAVAQLATFPERPFDQRQWVEQHYVQSVQAMAAVLDHHRQGAVGAGNYELESELHDKTNPDQHMDDMRSLMEKHYG